ncbi:probable UDP-N-acetylglucosamine--peptide N-acetylglucosaminyltransferase SPINDLY isoform X4 [Ipomoea triloba]|uniref:probable UDP-N-acetylglucosamine--peptide N-acetylglucosaminyltransferase SPINDLY isoform X4 n=1 Tax=Ipomoea triloba TaxID=35885 RepID=UPI00125DB10E|nr:probable UDP-N-acetylglucosamine--peptide N-acetylglucosaminyltransferase SPINDLY isoform X4 [Ipomoea triloba]
MLNHRKPMPRILFKRLLLLCCPTQLLQDAEQNSQGTPSSREEKVSSLKNGLIHVVRKMPKNAHAHFMLGLMYQRMGQPQKAASEYEKAADILVRPDEEVDRPELLSLIQIHHAECILLGSLEDCSSGNELEPKELEEILVKLKESVQSDVRRVSIWNILGLKLLRTGRLKSAISVFSALLVIAPDNLDCLGNLGITYLQSGDLELSEKCLQDLIMKDPNHPGALVNFAALMLCKYGSVVAGAGANADGVALCDQEAAANVAKECLLAATNSDPKAAHIWTNLANAYYLTGDHKSSGRCLEKAGKLEPNCLATRYAIGVHRIRDAERSQNPSEQQLSWAGNEMASIIREGDSGMIEPPIAWAGLAMVHKAQHEIAAGFEINHNELSEVKERANYSLKQAIAEDPEDAIHWHQLGLHFLCTQQFKMSQKYLKAAVACLKSSYAWSNLGISLHLSAESSCAEEVYKQALLSATPQQAHTIFSNLGNLYRQLKDYESAKAMLTKSLELQPGYAPAYNNLGLVFVAEGKWEEAKFCFDKAILHDPLLDSAKSNMIKARNMHRMYESMSSYL